MLARKRDDIVCPIRVMLDSSKRRSYGVQSFCNVCLHTCKSEYGGEWPAWCCGDGCIAQEVESGVDVGS